MPCVMVQSMPCSGEERIPACDQSVLTDPAVESFAEYRDPRAFQDVPPVAPGCASASDHLAPVAPGPASDWLGAARPTHAEAAAADHSDAPNTLKGQSVVFPAAAAQSFATLPGGHLSFATILPEEHASFFTEPPCHTSLLDRLRGLQGLKIPAWPSAEFSCCPRLDSLAPPGRERLGAGAAADPPRLPVPRKGASLAPAASAAPCPRAGGQRQGAAAKVQHASQRARIVDVPRPLQSRGGAVAHVRHGPGTAQPTTSFSTQLEPTEEESGWRWELAAPSHRRPRPHLRSSSGGRALDVWDGAEQVSSCRRSKSERCLPRSGLARGA
ncbi:unnamed protein product [Prorocentrum cordatum]|uniref:Uncharacterized protein n=1 Tax=Prorocentrum cordatum TaxID=2364126 RepID=A0ABN9RHR3_9DINO|nr:unnamed protein product [Polarella glacialis]